MLFGRDYCSHPDALDVVGDKRLCLSVRNLFEPCDTGKLFEDKNPPTSPTESDPKRTGPPNDEIREDQIFPNNSKRRWWQLFKR